MALYFSATTLGFYDGDIHTPAQIPVDAVEITEDLHRSLLEANSAGKQIAADPAGRPIAVDQVISEAEAKRTRHAQAQAALRESDIVVLRAYEQDIAVPLAWVDYRQALRDILNETGGDILPSPPPSLSSKS